MKTGIAIALCVALSGVGLGTAGAASGHARQLEPPVADANAASVAPSYSNPLALTLPDDVSAQQCADPDVIRSHDPEDPSWYLYCTRDALNSNILNADNTLRFYSIPTFKSTDLTHWTFVNEALPTKPAWIGNGDMWAPDVVFKNGTYYLYYTATESTGPGGGSAIGVATSNSPTGPWTDSGKAVVEPQDTSPENPGDRRWTFDPEVLTVGEASYIYFGSYHGGVFVRKLSADGLSTDPTTEVQVTIANRYEATSIVEHDGWYYLLGSATNCCGGPATGYAVFAGRSQSPTGPFVDRAGVSLLEGRVGGTPVLHQNGNRWIGTGHNTMITDYDGQQWILYHGVDRADPYIAGATGYTKRPLLMDPLDWKDAWPVVRGGSGPSVSPIPGPAAQPGQHTAYVPKFTKQPSTGDPIPSLSDEFSGTMLDSSWSHTGTLDPNSISLSGGSLIWQTQGGDLSPDPSNPTAVLTKPAPEGEFVLDTKVNLSVPANGCCQNYVQGGLVVYTDGGNFIKLVTASIWETRQNEFAKRESPVPAGYPEYGNTVGGPVAENTYLRIVRQHSDTEFLYTGYSSIDGVTWDEAGTWTTKPNVNAKIGLVSMAGTGFATTFDYVTVSTLAPLDDLIDPVPDPPTPPPGDADKAATGLPGTTELGQAAGTLAATGGGNQGMLWVIGCLAALGGAALRRRTCTRVRAVSLHARHMPV